MQTILEQMSFSEGTDYDKNRGNCFDSIFRGESQEMVDAVFSAFTPYLHFL